MNLTDVLTEIQLNEGLFLQGNYRDKKGLIVNAVDIIYDIFSKPVAEELMDGLGRTKFKTMPLFSKNRESYNAYTNEAFANDLRHTLKRGEKQYYKNPNNINKKFIDKREKNILDNLNNKKIVVNPETIRKKKGNYALILVHELIHVAYPYSESLVKACEDIYKIFKENWNPDGEAFFISKVLRGTINRDGSSSKISEILPYIVSDDINTEFLTEEGTYKLINYLKTCGLLNLKDGKEFWEKKFKNMIEKNKEGVPKFYKRIYNMRKRFGATYSKEDED